MKWQPWKEYNGRIAPEKIDLPEPPCKHCVYWYPHVEINLLKETGWVSHFSACIAEKMFDDFSCYAEDMQKDMKPLEPEACRD